ncbi:MAG TPA: universal stress protein [Gemmatimonadaceae bacterium]|jgi:nucleotide-binding universal stress UspA family protein|nr:universal stress protein [Gemmatimonadaceae bacterium]
MYQRILVPVEHSPYDDVVLNHVRKLARTCNDASIVLIHVADGWAARNINQLDLRESEEMRSDREYIEGIAESLERDGYRAEAILAGGDPANEIAACAKRENCDLIAMATHGHRGLSDVLRGSVASELRHISMVPVLMVRGLPHLNAAPSGPRPAQ